MAKPKFNTRGKRITFNIINKDTVDRLRRDGMIELPKRKLDIPKDMRWNEKLIASKVLKGLENGDSVQKISKSLQEVIGNNSMSAIRNARTMVTSAENHGRLDSMKNLSNKGVVMKKEWEATPDDRTRPSHIDIDGEEQDIDKPFSNGCMFPGDGHGPAEEVWMCRCAMGSHIVGFRRADGSVSYVNYDRDETLHDQQMRQERERRKGSGGSGGTSDLSYSEKIKNIIKEMEASGITEEKIMEAGKILADEVNATLDARGEEYRKAKAEVDSLGRKEINEIKNDQAYKDAQHINRGLMYPDESPYWKGKTRDDTLKYYNEKSERIRFLENSPQYREALRKEYQAERIMRGNFEDNIKLLRDKLSEVRKMGAEGIDKKVIKAHLSNSRSSARKSIEKAYSYYPTEWVQKSIDYGDMIVMKTGRGYYAHGFTVASDIAISGYSEASMTETAFHELGHRFEMIINGIIDSEKSFYERRTLGEELKWLGSGYRKDEKSRKDDFLSAYMGKDYGGKAYELVSMGFEYAYADPIRLKADADMQQWIFGILATL